MWSSVAYGGRLSPPVRPGGRVQNGCQEIRKRDIQCAPAAEARYLLGKTHWKKDGERPSVRISSPGARGGQQTPSGVHSFPGGVWGGGVPRGSGFEAGAVQAETKKRKKYYVLLGHPGAPRYNLYVDWRGSPSPGRGSAPAPAHSRLVLQSSAQFKFGILKRANWRCCYITIAIKKGSWSALTESFMKFAIIYAAKK